jgi:hypothetical protein
MTTEPPDMLTPEYRAWRAGLSAKEEQAERDRVRALNAAILKAKYDTWLAMRCTLGECDHRNHWKVDDPRLT